MVNRALSRSDARSGTVLLWRRIGRGVGTAVYAVVCQPSGTTQRLVAAKARLAKQGLTIPRLELISAHMATNLVVNVHNALNNVPAPNVYGWLDSTVALHWIKGNGQYKQFVANRVNKSISIQKLSGGTSQPVKIRPT